MLIGTADGTHLGHRTASFPRGSVAMRGARTKPREESTQLLARERAAGIHASVLTNTASTMPRQYRLDLV